MLVIVQDQLPVREFLKLPVLIVHYHEHQLRNNKISFSEFLYLHYALEDDYDHDRSRDMQLPFKHIHVSGSAVNAVPSSWSYEFAARIYACCERIQIAEDFLFIPSCLSGKIWQPPKLA